MATPRITVKPIITLAGDHEVNQVFFDDVRVPQGNRVGPENEGWSVAKYLLEFERGGGGAATHLEVEIDELRAIARLECDGSGNALIDDPEFAARIAILEVRVMAPELAELETLSRMSAGGCPGAASSLLKNAPVDIAQQIELARFEAIHYYGLMHPSARLLPAHAATVAACYLNGRAASIYGASKEVQKNIIAKDVLGL
jgi:alkylation response protein AidB-like acyl-CoA dehydrogenase